MDKLEKIKKWLQRNSLVCSCVLLIISFIVLALCTKEYIILFGAVIWIFVTIALKITSK